ncbi:MAG: FGGY-family carbohydrate kinase [Spirochaetia bacterium]|nr:FGGY-family carbohydrate kinase [Spirochaetia bacterium]
MAKDKYILAFDLGTSGPKVALVSTYGEVIHCEIETTQLHLLPHGGAEQEPDDWWRAIKRATHKLLAKKLVPVDAIDAITTTTQWSGTVAVDAGGTPLCNAIIWMDSRGAAYAEKVTGGLVQFEGYGVSKLWTWLRLTGGIPARSGKDSIAHILYIKEELPQIFKNTYKFLEPKDYLNLKLTGKFAAGHDSIALHWVTDNRDINRIDYHPKLLRLAGIPREKLPDLLRPIDILGPIKDDIAEELGLKKGVHVVMGTPDLQSAAVGSGAVRDFQGHLYIGTSSWLTCHVPFKKTDVFHNMATLPSAIPGRYFIANEQETAGYCLTWLRDNLFFPKDELAPDRIPAGVYDKFSALASQVPPGSGGAIFTPWLYGERTPVEDHTVRGAFYNVSLSTTRAHMVRSVMEGVALNSRWLLKYVESFNGQRMDAINMIGGGARSNVWCQIIADVLGRDIRQVKDPVEANARGAGFIGAVALGYCSFDDIADRTQIANTFTPNPDNAKLYGELFKEFINIYNKNRGIYRRLNK